MERPEFEMMRPPRWRIPLPPDPGDPVPEYIIDQLPKEALFELLRVRLEASRLQLEAQLKLVEGQTEILARFGK